MSQEEAARAAQERDDAAAAEAAASEEQKRASSWGNNASTPPAPNYQPPLPPSSLPSGQRPIGYESEDNVPDRTLRTIPAAAATSAQGPAKSVHGLSAAGVERRETTVLPVVEEAAEGTSTGDRSRHSRISSLGTESDGRPLTPAKDGDEMEPGFGNPLLGGHSSSGNSSKARGPPTPPKTGHGYNTQLKPESADSGYGVSGSNGSNGSNGGLRSLTGSQKSLNIRPQVSRDSLDKALPPLPKIKPPTAQGLF